MRQFLTAVAALALLAVAGIAIWKQLNQGDEQHQPVLPAATAPR